MNKKGFTLIEMLVVILLIAIIMVVAIPAVRNLTYNGNQTKYKQVENMVREASELYVNKHSGEFADSIYSCLVIPYSSLVTGEYIEEEDIHCTGNITVSKRESSGYDYKLYLTCKNDNGKVIYESKDSVPSDCELFSSN